MCSRVPPQPLTLSAGLAPAQFLFVIEVCHEQAYQACFGSLAPILKSFLCSVVKLEGMLACHEYTGLAFFFLILCVMKVWHLGLSPAIRFGPFSGRTKEELLCAVDV